MRHGVAAAAAVVVIGRGKGLARWLAAQCLDFGHRFLSCAHFYHVLHIFWHLLQCQILILHCSKYIPHASPSERAISKSGYRFCVRSRANFRRRMILSANRRPLRRIMRAPEVDPRMLPILLQQLFSAATRAHRSRPVVGLLRPKRARKRVNLALQGGGAHGAFTWGVLDQILADGRLEIEGIAGTSAGAVNAALVADGLARGGAEDARQRLADFWRAVSVNGHLPDLQRGVVDRLFSFAPQAAWLGALSALLVAVRSQPAQHQSAEGADRALRRFRGDPARQRSRAVHLGDRRAHRRAQGVHPRGDHARGGDGLGLPAAPVPRGRDRRRALLGRRLQRQSGDLSVPARDLDRGRAGRADQSAPAAPRRRCRRGRS